MIKLVGEKLRQYDLNRTVEITPANGRTVEMVRFIRGRKPYMLAHREEGGKIVADIPNILLKSFGAVKCTVDYVDEDGHIVTENQSFYVNKRDMPAGYSYTETDTLELGEGGTGGTSKYQQPEWGAGTDVLLAETTYNTADDGDLYITTPVTFVDGETYTVYWNGTAYECDALSVTDDESGKVLMTLIGDVGAISGEPSGTHPFCIAAIVAEGFAPEGVYGQIMPLDGTESFTVSIEGYKIHPIPAEYIENDSAGVLCVNVISDLSGADRTYEEILKAINKGMFVFVRMTQTVDADVMDNFMWLCGITTQRKIVFYTYMGTSTYINCAPDNTWASGGA